MTLLRGSAIEQILRAIADDFIDGVATADGGAGGDTMIDTVMLSGNTPGVPVTGILKKRVIFISSTTDGLAPVGEYKIISGNTNASGTVNVSPAFSAQVNTGDEYGICKATIPLRTVEKLFND